MITIFIFILIGLLFAILIAKKWCINEKVFDNLFLLFYGACAGLIFAVILPADLGTIKQDYKIIPFNKDYSIGYDKNRYYVQIKDITGFHLETFDAKTTKVIYDSTYNISMYRNYNKHTLWNYFALDLDDEDVNKAIIKVPEKSIMLYYTIENN